MGYFYTTLCRIWEGAISSVGSHLTFDSGGILFLGFSASFWCGAYGYAVSSAAGWGTMGAVATGFVLSVVSAALFGFFYGRMSNESFSVITLAAVLGCDALIRSWDTVTGGVLGIAGVPRPDFAKSLAGVLLVQTTLAVAVLIAESMFLRTSYGRSLRALKENKQALTAMGTSPTHIGQGSIYVASVGAGVVGMLAAMRVQFLDPSLGGIVMLVQVLSIGILAHGPKTWRLLLSTVVLVLIPELLRFVALPVSVLGYVRSMIYGFVLVILIYYITSKSSTQRIV